jgi:hypothetical protein
MPKNITPNEAYFRDAVAEAKVLKETALANARMVIEEAFQPQLSSMLSRKLRTEMNDATHATDGYGSEEGGETDTEAVLDVPADSENVAVDSSEIGKGNNKQPSNDADDSTHIGKKKAEHTVDLSESLEEETLEEADADLDLESVIRELEQDLDLNKDEEEEEDEEDMFGDEEAEDDMDMDDEDELDMDIDAEEDEDEDEEELDLDLDGEEGDEDEFDADEDEEELDLEEILREMEAEEMNEEEAVAEELQEEVSELRFENAKLKQSIKEHRDVVTFLKNKLHEVNMLNAKLLYTNKLFKSFELSNEQKQRIVENFDRATTLREVKLVFATLSEGISTKANRRSTAKPITEGFASRATGGNTVAKNPEMLNESKTVDPDTEFRARMMKLANIKIS